MNLAQKLVEVAAECGYVQKGATNTFHKYNYAAAAAVLEKVNGALTKRGIAQTVNPEIVSVFEKVIVVRVTLTLIDAESGETLTTAGLGAGSDTGDKAVMKAETAAIKYAWMLALNISTGDDPEADASTDAPPATTPKPTVRPPLPPAAVEKARSFAAPIVASAPPPPDSDLYKRVVAIREEANRHGANLVEIPRGHLDSVYASWIEKRSAENPLVKAAAEVVK